VLSPDLACHSHRSEHPISSCVGMVDFTLRVMAPDDGVAQDEGNCCGSSVPSLQTLQLLAMASFSYRNSITA
jgi:hypothetical protein